MITERNVSESVKCVRIVISDNRVIRWLFIQIMTAYDGISFFSFEHLLIARNISNEYRDDNIDDKNNDNVDDN